MKQCQYTTSLVLDDGLFLLWWSSGCLASENLRKALIPETLCCSTCYRCHLRWIAEWRKYALWKWLWCWWTTACPVLNLSVRCCILKTRTLQMNPTRTTIAHIADPMTCNVASIHRYLVAGPVFGYTSPENSSCCLCREDSQDQWVISQPSQGKLTQAR